MMGTFGSWGRWNSALGFRKTGTGRGWSEKSTFPWDLTKQKEKEASLKKKISPAIVKKKGEGRGKPLGAFGANEVIDPGGAKTPSFNTVGFRGRVVNNVEGKAWFFRSNQRGGAHRIISRLQGIAVVKNSLKGNLGARKAFQKIQNRWVLTS